MVCNPDERGNRNCQMVKVYNKYVWFITIKLPILPNRWVKQWNITDKGLLFLFW
jgi:hypothetical protein